MRPKIDALPTTTRSAAEDASQLPTLRAELDQQRRFRTEQLQDLALQAAEAVATADQNRLQVTRILTMAAEAALSEIDAALQRLEKSSYGICQRCAEPIPWARLEVLPMTRLCTPCQYLAESGPVQQRAPRPRPVRQRNPVTGG
ncbi:MAG TPA: TraR/DksA C4-type zinc finger protein [Propionibacteriaceae bacterium]|nr:TraR/DksA C4-type zinc finger protein [Propionibacteriaceae bacterium]